MTTPGTGSFQWMFSMEIMKSILTYLTAPPTVARKVGSSNHVLSVLGAFPKGSPSLTTLIQICAVPTSIQDLVK